MDSSEKDATEFDTRAYRKALGSFVTGVTVVTTLDDDVPRGFTANSFTSVSLDPPLVLVCVDRRINSYPVFSKASAFAVNVLADDQRSIANIFASKEQNKFRMVDWTRSRAGSPVIAGTSALFDCTVHERYDCGDHEILVGRVQAFGTRDHAALGYWRGAYVYPTLAESALTAMGQGGSIGVILEDDNAIALVKRDDGSMDLPSSKKILPVEDKTTLYGKLASFGITPRLEFIYAVVQEVPGESGDVSVYYRGRIESGTPDRSKITMVGFDKIDQVKINSNTEYTMLQRFVRERQQLAFGIYMGDNRSGVVKKLVAG